MAGLVTVRCNVDAALSQVQSLQQDQLPFIIARSLTAVAVKAQGAARMMEPHIFNLRNDWTVRNTKITPATKQSMISEVYTDTGNRKTGAPDYLLRQEEGGERVPVAGHSYLAIPTRYIWKYTSKNRPLPDNFRPAALLPPGANVGEFFAGTFSSGSRASGTKRLLGKASLKKLGNGEFVAFLQHTRAGTLCIFVRHGGMGYRGSQDAEPWFNLVREAHVPARLGLQGIVEEVVAHEFAGIFITVAREVGISIDL